MRKIWIVLLFLSLISLHVLAKDNAYNRKDYPHWIDSDQDCQDTRMEVLIMHSSSPVKFKRNSETVAKSMATLGKALSKAGRKKPSFCHVTSGKWEDPYTGLTYTKSSELSIDHIVPLKHAHTNGAKDWDLDKRRKFANDFENLVPVSHSINSKKGDKGPLRWMPPNKAYTCTYLKIWVHIKKKYELNISNQEREFVYKKLKETCPNWD